MKKTWQTIQSAVAASLLSEEEKRNVLSALDTVIGGYLIEDTIPIERNDLTENEFVVYREILEAVNPPQLRTDNDYNKTVGSIMKEIRTHKNKKNIQKMLVDLDTAWNDGDKRKANDTLKKIYKEL